MPGPREHAILYDADCGFCTRSVDRILRLDRRRRLRAVAIQSEEGGELLRAAAVPQDQWLQSWHLIGADGGAISGGAAAVPLLRLLPAGRPFAALLAALPGPRDAVYAWVAAHRDLFGRFLVLALAIVVAGGVGVGCGSTVQDGSRLTVYVSDPFVAGAERALEDAGGEAAGAPVEIKALDESAGRQWTQAGVAANARSATEDSTSIAYIGELDPRATRISAAITNEAGLLQLSPAPLPRSMLAAPGGNDVPTAVQTTGERTLATTAPEGDPGDSVYRSGYEPMALVLDSIERATDPLSRADVISALLATSDRQGRTGTYTIGPDGAAVYER